MFRESQLLSRTGRIDVLGGAGDVANKTKRFKTLSGEEVSLHELGRRETGAARAWRGRGGGAAARDLPASYYK